MSSKFSEILESYQDSIDSQPDFFEIIMNTFENLIVYSITAGIPQEKQADVLIHSMGSLIKRFHYNQSDIHKGELQ